MKRLHVLFAVALLCLGVSSSASVLDVPSAEANVTVMIAGGAGGDSPSYTLAWTGEHASGDDYWSDGHQSDPSAMNAINDTYANNGSEGAQVTGNNQFLRYANYNMPAVGTVWCYVNMRNPSGTRTSEAQIWEWHADSDDSISVRIEESDDSIIISWEAQTGSIAVDLVPDETFTEDTWVAVGFTWDMNNDNNSIVVGSTDWADGTEDTSTDLGAFDTTPSNFCIGEYAASGSFGSTEEYWVDDFYFITGEYKAAYPGD